MICDHCKSEEFHEGNMRLNNGTTQVIIYCANCGQIMSRKSLRAMPENKTRKSWAERKALASVREANKLASLTWAERKRRKALDDAKSNQESTDNTNVSQLNQKSTDGEPF